MKNIFGKKKDTSLEADSLNQDASSSANNTFSNQNNVLSEADFTRTQPSKSNGRSVFSSALEEPSLAENDEKKMSTLFSKFNKKKAKKGAGHSINTEGSNVKGTRTKEVSLNSSNIEKYKKSLPLIGKLPAKQQYILSISLLTLSAIGVLSGIYLNSTTQGKLNLLQNNTVSLIGDLQSLSTYSTQAVAGKSEAFGFLTKQKEQIATKLKKIDELSADLKINSTNMSSQIEQVKKNWSTDLKSLEKIERAKEFLSDSTQKTEQVGFQAAQIAELSDQMAFIQYQVGGSQNDLSNVFYVRDTVNKINASVSQLLLGDKPTYELVSSLQQDKEGIKKALVEMRWGDAKRNIGLMRNNALLANYNKLGFEWLRFSETTEQILKRSNDILEVKQNITELVRSISASSNDLNNAIQQFDATSYPDMKLAQYLMIGFALLLILSIISIIYIYLFEKENNALLDKSENQKNQQAILRLLDEMGPFSEGDLTKQTTVTEDITGAVADAINVAIDDLGSLVRKIQKSTQVMKNKTETANQLSVEMLNLSEKQAQNIEETGESVLHITDAIGKISFKTSEGAKVASQSVKASNQGETSVAQSIEAMGSIKNQMGETVRLMKRLIDSSRQISEIVEVLSDITEETSVLALNATVQAARAGEAGKGFKIVADSVQSLANKASDATRKVGALINTTQTDIQEIVAAVERTNFEVAKGTELSQQAGSALQEINIVSKKLLEIINNISKDTREHTSLASEVSSRIKEILSTTKQTQESNKETAVSISEINKISDDLSVAVKNFKVE